MSEREKRRANIYFGLQKHSLKCVVSKILLDAFLWMCMSWNSAQIEGKTNVQRERDRERQSQREITT
jgi:hypothetical protein